MGGVKLNIGGEEFALVRAEELTSCLGTFAVSAAGWYRVAKIATVSSKSCTISIKRNWNAKPECHKVELINVHNKSIFKSIYDMTEGLLNITKIRHVIDSNGVSCMDFYYNSNDKDRIGFVIEDAVSGSSTFDLWKPTDSILTVPETYTGETILATMDFGTNTWLGQPM